MRIFIPIRKESGRVPRKNFRHLGGVPLWEHTIRKLTGHNVYVDTDDTQLMDALHGTFSYVFAYPRSADLSPDHSVNDLVKYFFDQWCKGIDPLEPIAQIHVTSPFLEIDTVARAAAYLQGFQDRFDSVVATTTFYARFWRQEEWEYQQDDYRHRYIPINHNPGHLEDTQNLLPLDMENSLFYVFTKASFQRTGNRVGSRPELWPVEFPQNVDIDDEATWKMCLALRRAGYA